MLQSTPHLPWPFPDAVASQNRFRPAYVPSKLSPSPNIMAVPTDAHSHFAANAHREAMARVVNTAIARAGMEGKLDTTARSQRYTLPASRSAVPNGRFTGDPNDYSTYAGIRGGRINTLEGQKWLAKRLVKRAKEFELLNQEQFSDMVPDISYENDLLFPRTDELDSLFTYLFDILDSGAINSNIIAALNRIENTFFQLANVLTAQDLGNYARIMQNVKSIMGGFYTPELDPNARPKAARIIKNAKLAVERIIDLIYELVDIVNTAGPNRDARIIKLRRRQLESRTAAEREPAPEYGGQPPEPEFEDEDIYG